jgi:hypothetical protein
MALPVFIDEVPEYEDRGEIMLVRWRGLEIALPIAICIQAVLLCEEALAKRKLARLGGNVVRFTRKRK